MTCTKPPQGWKCTRIENHEGPCAAVEVQDVEEALIEWRKDREHELYGHRQSFRDGFEAGKASQQSPEPSLPLTPRQSLSSPLNQSEYQHLRDIALHGAHLSGPAVVRVLASLDATLEQQQNLIDELSAARQNVKDHSEAVQRAVAGQVLEIETNVQMRKELQEAQNKVQQLRAQLPTERQLRVLETVKNADITRSPRDDGAGVVYKMQQADLDRVCGAELARRAVDT